MRCISVEFSLLGTLGQRRNIQRGRGARDRSAWYPRKQFNALAMFANIQLRRDFPGVHNHHRSYHQSTFAQFFIHTRDEPLRTWYSMCLDDSAHGRVAEGHETSPRRERGPY